MIFGKTFVNFFLMLMCREYYCRLLLVIVGY